MKLTVLIINSLLLLSSCKSQDPQVEIENIINSLKENKTQTEHKRLDESLNILRTFSVREKLNNPDLYDMKSSVEEIVLQTIKNKSYNKIIELANEYLNKNKKRIKFLEKEIENRRASLVNSSKDEPVKMLNYSILDTDNLSIKMNFKSSSAENRDARYLYLTILYSLKNNNTLQTIGYSDKKTSGIIHAKSSSFSVSQLLSKEVIDIISKSGVPSYPITDLSAYGIGVQYYISEFKDDYDGAYKPRKEDDYESKKSLEELKKDLMKLKLLVANLEN